MTSHRQSTRSFFLLAFTITWSLQLPGAFAQRGLLPIEPSVYLPFAGLGIFGPLVAATYLTFREGGKTAVKALYAGLFRWRVHIGWYVMALLLPGTLLVGLLSGLNLAGRQGPVFYVPAALALVASIVISLAEEVGWRGYALPRLQERWGAFAASCLLGALWYLWHVPMFLALGVPLNLALVMLLYFVGPSLFITWAFNGTKGSLLVAVLVHLGAHLNNSHRALPEEALPLVVHAIIYAGLGLFLMRKTLALPSTRFVAQDLLHLSKR